MAVFVSYPEDLGSNQSQQQLLLNINLLLNKSLLKSQK